MGDDAEFRRYLVYGCYGLLAAGVLVALFVHHLAGTAIIVAAVMGLVVVAVTADDAGS